MFNETKKIIQSAESLLIGKLRNGTPKFIDFLISDSFFIYTGLKFFFLPIKKFLIILAVSLTALLLISHYLYLDKPTKDALIMVGFFLPISVVFFARPSKYCFELITSEMLSELGDVIEVNGIASNDKINSLRKNIALAEQRVGLRNKKLNWLFGSYLAVCLFMFNYFWRFAIEIGKFDLQMFFDSVTLPAILFLFFTPFFYVLVGSYKKGNDAVFQLINLSIVELEVALNRKVETKTRRSKRRGYPISNN